MLAQLDLFSQAIPPLPNAAAHYVGGAYETLTDKPVASRPRPQVEQRADGRGKRDTSREALARMVDCGALSERQAQVLAAT